MNKKILVCNKIKGLVSFFIAIIFLTCFVSFSKTKATDYNISKGDKVIPIAMATDNRYILPTLVSMTSICENKNKDTVIKFNIMLSGEVNAENKKKMKKLQELYKNVSVDTFDMKNKFSEAYLTSYITTATYYRCCIPSLLKQYGKVLYIDTDTVITTDLWDLFSTDISEYYIAGVKDMGMCFRGSYLNNYYYKKLGIKNMNQYVNAGILLINNKKMREDNIERKFYDYIPSLASRELLLQDQDVFNAVCYGKIKLVSPEYNWMICHARAASFEQLMSLYCDVCDHRGLNKAQSYPAIIHYCGYEKPWNTTNIPFYQQWDNYRKIVDKKILNDGYPVSYGIYNIVSSIDENYAIDVERSKTQDEANVWLWSRNGTNAQRFRLINIKGDEYEIEPMCSGKRIDVYGEGKEAGTNIQQFSRHGRDNQRFYVKHVGNGYYTIQSKCNGLFVDVRYSEIKDGTNIWCWPGNGTNAQKFKFVVA